MTTTTLSPSMKPIARAGLISKGTVYCLLGILAFMAAFEIGGQSNKDADKKGVFNLIEGLGGKLFLALIAAGLLCYTVWRVVQAFSIGRNEEKNAKNTSRIIRYLASGLVYLSFSLYAWKKLLGNGGDDKGDATQSAASDLMQKPFGPWLVGIFGLTLAAIGIYQIYYGLSEKYRKHVDSLNLNSAAARNVLRAGKIGYVARGLVWLIIAWLLGQSALHANSSEAGDMGKAFQFLENASYGSYLLGALGLGLICYGVFTFIRTRAGSF